MWIYVVLDVDSYEGGKVLKAFLTEEKADEYAVNYYEETGIDTRYERTFLREE